GLGMLTPLGLDAEQTWRALLDVQSGIGAITHFDASACQTKIAGEVKGFDALKWMKLADAKATDRFQQLAMAAAQIAMQDAGLPARRDGVLAPRAGCYIGTGIGGLTTLKRAFEALAQKGPRYGTSAYFIPAIIANLGAGRVSMVHNLQGPSLTHATACA